MIPYGILTSIINKFKISASRWNDKFKLPDGLYSVRYSRLFEYVIKKREKLLGHTTKQPTDNLPIRIYVNEIENEITFKNKSRTSNT